jgi:hypothetical protein
MEYSSIWIAGLSLSVLLLAIALAWSLWHQRRPDRRLPRDWALSARPVFSADERRVYRLLREALPHHVVLSKLPLVRFCQPQEARQVRYWFDLLGGIHVTFAICSPNGRVLAAIDLEQERGITARHLDIKNAVLDACRVRYLRVAMDQLPSLAELQLLVPPSRQSRGPQSASLAPRDTASDWGQFSQPLPLWQDGSMFHETDFGGRRSTHRPTDIAGVVVDELPPSRFAPQSR